MDYYTVNYFGEYELNFIRLRYDPKIEADHAYIEYDVFDIENATKYERDFYEYCIKMETRMKPLREEIVLSHWIMFSGDIRHFLLKSQVFENIVICNGRHLVYWFLEINTVPDGIRKCGSVFQSHWMENITIKLIEEILKETEGTMK